MRSLQRGKPSLPTHVRDYNRAAVLQRLFRQGQMSRSDLARGIGLTKVTVSALVAELMAEGVIVELGEDARPGTPGKRPTLLALSEDQRCIVAVDLTREGGLFGAIMTLTGEPLVRLQKSSPLSLGEEGVAELTHFTRDLVAKASVPVLGVGVSTPGIVTVEGTILRAPKRGWFDLPLQERLTKELGLPVTVANDANCAALGELAFGEATGDNVLSVLVGDGIGAGLVVGGALVNGATSAAGEIAHITATYPGAGSASCCEPRRCACGRYGCLETLLSEPELREALAGLPTEQRDAHLAEVGRRVGSVLAPSVALLNLSDIIFAGPHDLLGPALLEAVREEISTRLWPAMNLIPTVRESQLDDHAPLVGAAVLVMQSALGIP